MVGQVMVSPLLMRALVAAAALSALSCGDGAQVVASPGGEGEGEQNTEGAEGSGAEPTREPLPASSTRSAGASGSEPAAAATPAAASSAGSSSVAPTPSVEPDPTPAPPAALPRELRGACDLAQRIGGFSIEAQADFGVVQGVVADAVLPTAVPLLVSETGACRMLERRNLVCLPACAGAEACGELGSCIPYPRQVDVGVVAIAGLTRPTSMSPLEPGNTYFSPGADNPPYAPDATVALSAQGGSGLAAFELFGRGSAPLLEAPQWQLARGASLSVTWAAPSSGASPGMPGATHVLLELTIDQHGVSPFSLVCQLEDTGSATVPATIIAQL